MRKQNYAVTRTNHEKMVEINQYKAKDLLWPSAIRKFFATIGIEVPIPFTTLFVFVPAFDRYILPVDFTDGINESTGQTSIGNQRDIIIHGSPADFITVIQIPFCMILRNVNHHIYFFIPQVVHNIRFFLCVGPMKDGDTNTVFLKELSRACCCKNMISFGNEHFCRIE